MHSSNCRLCFKKLEENYSSIFDSKNEELSLGAKIMVCLSIPVQEGDCFSQKICIPCREEVTRFYDFREKCLSAYYYLLQLYNNEESVNNEEELNSSLTKEEILESVDAGYEEAEKGPEINLEAREDNGDLLITNSEASRTGEEQKLTKEYKCFYCELIFDSYEGAVEHCAECLKVKEATDEADNSKDDKITDLDYAEIEFIEDMDCDVEEKNENKAEELMEYQEVKNLDDKEDNFADEDYISSDEPYQDESENKDPEEPSENISKPQENPETRPKRRYRKKKIYPENYPCPECNKTFTSRSLMRRHFMVHTGERPHECETCGRRFSQLGALNFHRKLHDDPPYRCNLCSKPFMRPSDLEKHLRIHTGEKPFTCTVCGKSFTQLVAVQQHERVHTGDKPFQCKVCGKTFSQSANKSKHEKIHQKGAKPFVCDLCGRSFSDTEEMEEHKAGHGGRKARECDFCGMRFKKFCEVVDHVRRFHTFERPHTCDICKKAFYSLYSLKQHIMTHTGQKPFACAECPQKFTQKGNLAKHFARKHPGKIFKDVWNNKEGDSQNGVENFEENSADISDADKIKL